VTFVLCAGFLQDCKHDIRAATNVESNAAIVLFRNLLLDPVYLDLVLFFFRSAKYNRITYTMESYLWVRAFSLAEGGAAPGSIREQSDFVASVPTHPDISRQIQVSIQCALVLESRLLISPSEHKTDLYNISKMRSFVYTSLQSYAVHNVDIIARPRLVVMFLYDSPLNQTEIYIQLGLGIRVCLPAQIHGPVHFSTKRYIQHAQGNMSGTIVTEMHIRGVFCPSALELSCIHEYTGTSIINQDATCVADIDILFTSFNPQQVLSTFEQYIEQIQGFDTEMRLLRPNACAEVLYIRHKATSLDYADIIDKQQFLSGLHETYHTQFGDAILFDSGVNTLSVYNVTMKLGSSHQPTSTLSAINFKRKSEEQAQQKTHVVRVLALFGVILSEADVGVPTGMSLRENSQDARSVIFSLTGAVISASEVVKMLDTVVFLSSGTNASSSSTVSVLSNSISGTLFFDALSVAEAKTLCVHVEAYRAYYLPADGPLFNAIITQNFVIPNNLFAEGVSAQNYLRSLWVDDSTYMFRVTVRIPIEVSMMNSLLVEVLKTVIFTKATVGSVQLASLSGQGVLQGGVDDHNSSATQNTEYSFIVYELPVVTVEECDIEHTANTEDYFTEMAGLVSSLFGVSVGFEMHSACLVSNTLHPTASDSTGPECETLVCDDGTVAQYAATHVFLNQNSVAYTQGCTLQTSLVGTAQIHHTDDLASGPHNVSKLQRTLTYGRPGTPLVVGVEASIQISDSRIVPGQLVHTFASIYNPDRYNSSFQSTVDSTGGFFSHFTGGLSAREKPGCVLARQERVLLLKGCMHNLSISQSHGSSDAMCLSFSTLNSRIDLDSLRRFILTKTTPDMLQTAITIDNQLDAYIGSMPCAGGVHPFIGTLTQSDATQSTYFNIEPKRSTRLVLVVQHVTPFIHISDYQKHVLRLVQPEQVEPTFWHTSTSAVLHLYTKGVAFDTAHAFFQPLFQEYIEMQLSSTTNIRVQVVEIEPILQYKSSFPYMMFERDESRVQLYVQVHLFDMVECAEIQDILEQRVVHQNFYGINMEATLIDAVDMRVTCNNTISLEYSSLQCANTAEQTQHLKLLDTSVAGGIIVSTNATCVQGVSPECSARLSSSDVGLFFAILHIVTTQVHPFLYYFEHIVNFCGLDPNLLRALITTESLDFFGIFTPSTPLISTACVSHALEQSVV